MSSNKGIYCLFPKPRPESTPLTPSFKTHASINVNVDWIHRSDQICIFLQSHFNPLSQWFSNFFLCDAFGKVYWTCNRNKMLIKTHIIKVYIIDESTIKKTLIFCLICTFVQTKVKHCELPDTFVTSSFYIDSFLMNATILSDTSSISLSDPCIGILSLFNLAKTSLVSQKIRSKLNNQHVDYFHNWLLLSRLYLSDPKWTKIVQCVY